MRFILIFLLFPLIMNGQLTIFTNIYEYDKINLNYIGGNKGGLELKTSTPILLFSSVGLQVGTNFSSYLKVPKRTFDLLYGTRKPIEGSILGGAALWNSFGVFYEFKEEAWGYDYELYLGTKLNLPHAGGKLKGDVFWDTVFRADAAYYGYSFDGKPSLGIEVRYYFYQHGPLYPEYKWYLRFGVDHLRFRHQWGNEFWGKTVPPIPNNLGEVHDIVNTNLSTRQPAYFDLFFPYLETEWIVFKDKLGGGGFVNLSKSDVHVGLKGFYGLFGVFIYNRGLGVELRSEKMRIGTKFQGKPFHSIHAFMNIKPMLWRKG